MDPMEAQRRRIMAGLAARLKAVPAPEREAELARLVASYRDSVRGDHPGMAPDEVDANVAAFEADLRETLAALLAWNGAGK